jgi:hypothetical protein
MEEESRELLYVQTLHAKVYEKFMKLDTWDYSELTKANLSAHIEASLSAAGPVKDVRGHADKSAAWMEKHYSIVRQEPATARLLTAR